MRDDEMNAFLAQADIPPHSPDLPERIIAASMAAGHEQKHVQQAVAATQVKQGRSFGGWWADMCQLHGQKMAVAAACAAIAVVVFDPAGKATQYYLDQKEMADAARYTVDGMPLLVDVALMEEPELNMEEVVVYQGQG